MDERDVFPEPEEARPVALDRLTEIGRWLEIAESHARAGSLYVERDQQRRDMDL